MRKVAIIFDSTAIINEENIKKYDISFVSLNVAINGENFRSMDLDEEKFKNEFLTYKSVKSGSPSPHDFEEAINRKFDEGYKEVVVITLSSKISATYNVAGMGREALSEERKANTYIHDSLFGSIGQDVLIKSMESLLDKDPSASEIMEALEARLAQNTILFELNDLKHLHKGGRLSTLKYFISMALKIKPLVEFSNGELKVVGQNRNRSKTIEIIMNRIDGFVSEFKNIYVNLFSYHPDDNIFIAVHDIIKKRWPQIELNMTTRIEPIFMTHVGVHGYAVSIVSFN